MNLQELLDTYKLDDESVFNTWFINNDEQLKAFRSIRRGVQQVIEDIKMQQFGNDYKGFLTYANTVMPCAHLAKARKR